MYLLTDMLSELHSVSPECVEDSRCMYRYKGWGPPVLPGIWIWGVIFFLTRCANGSPYSLEQRCGAYTAPASPAVSG